MRSAPCTYRGCRRITQHVSERCHDHRFAKRSTAAPVGLAPPSLATGPAPKETRKGLPNGDTLVTFTVNGVLHRTDGPAEVILRLNGKRHDRWWVNGVSVREDGPVERTRRNAEVFEERWRTKEIEGGDEGGWHREDGPAVTEYAIFGTVVNREWWNEGRLHRADDAPAKTLYWDNGRVKDESFYFEGKLHRDVGPAQVVHRQDGTGRTEYHYQNGEKHRIDGPAATSFSSKHAAPEPQWWITGRKYDSREDAFRVLANRTGPKIREALAGSSFAPLLDEGHRPAAVAGALRDGVTTVEGVREVLAGAPPEWVRAYEESR